MKTKNQAKKMKRIVVKYIKFLQQTRSKIRTNNSFWFEPDMCELRNDLEWLDLYIETGIVSKGQFNNVALWIKELGEDTLSDLERHKFLCE